LIGSNPTENDNVIHNQNMIINASNIYIAFFVIS